MRLGTSLGKNKYKLIFLSILFVLGIIFGIIFFMGQSDVVKTAIGTEMDMFKDLIRTTNQNQIIYHLIVILILFSLNFTVIGFIINVFYLFYEGCSLGFSIAIFAYKFKTSGVLFSILFNIITKTIFILLIIYICLLGIKISKKILGSLVLKQDEITHYFIKRHLILLCIVISISLLSDIVLYFLGSKLLNIFLFLL